MRIDGKWVAKATRDADAQSPAGGVSSSARDLGAWMRLQINGGLLAGAKIIEPDALAETHRPQMIRAPAPKDPAIDRAGLYGLGWNVDYDGQGRIRLGHSGAFNLGAATAVSLLPNERLGIIVLTNAQPVGAPEAVCRGFLDLALAGKVERD
jgi:CubicO group peptidase (beta-lactamase class C family)